MPVTLRSTLAAFAFPGGFFALLAILFLRPTGLPTWIQPLVHLLPYGVLVFAALFAWLFDRGRVLLTLLLLVMTDYVLATMGPLAQADGAFPMRRYLSYQAAAFLVPLNLLALTIFSRDRIRSVQTLSWLILLLLQATVLTGLQQVAPDELGSVLQTALIPRSWTVWSPIPQAGLLAFLVATGLLVSRYLESRNSLDTGFAWATVMLYVAFVCPKWGWDPRGFLMTAVLILVATLVLAAYRSAHRDELTGLPDREVLDLAVQRLPQRYAVALLEIDQLREVNNTYGRRVGDQLMSMAARKIVHASGAGKVFRYGQDQFLVLFPGKVPNDTLIALESMRKAVVSLDLLLRNRVLIVPRKHGAAPAQGTEEVLPVTLSVGTAGPGERPGRWEDVMKAASTALFQAKHEGGNVVRRAVPTERVAAGSGRTRVPAELNGWRETGT